MTSFRGNMTERALRMAPSFPGSPGNTHRTFELHPHCVGCCSMYGLFRLRITQASRPKPPIVNNAYSILHPPQTSVYHASTDVTDEISEPWQVRTDGLCHHAPGKSTAASCASQVVEMLADACWHG